MSITVSSDSLAVSAVLLVAFVAIEMRSQTPMLDLRLLRVPTFDGGLIAAWAVSASIFSLLTYIVLYLQNILGYSAIDTGLRLLPLSGAMFVTAALAGRLTGYVSTRWLIAPGFAVLGVGVLLMRGLSPNDTWSHLLPGLIVCGVGAGLINVPLASTAVGVVEPARAGMASGINSTFRQVGIATGVAALGSILASEARSTVITKLAGTPLGAHAHVIGHALSSGQVASALQTTPGPLRGLAAEATRTGFVDALNTILLIGAIIALLAALSTFVLIRQRDFVGAEGHEGGATLEATPVIG